MKSSLASVMGLISIFTVSLLVGSAAFAAGGADNDSPPRGNPAYSNNGNNNGNGGLNNNNNNDDKFPDYCKMNVDNEAIKNKFCSTEKDKDKCLRELLQSCKKGNSGSKCDQARNEFSSAQRDFVKACGKGNMSLGGGCEAQVNKCMRCMGGSSEGDCDDMSVDLKELDRQLPTDIAADLRNKLSGGVVGYNDALKITPNLSKVKMKYGNCPALAGADYKSLQKEVEDGQKKVDEARKKIPKLQQEMTDMQAKLKEEQAKAEDRLNEAKMEWQKSRDEIDEKLFKDQEALRDQLQKLRDSYNRGRDSITQLGWKKNEARIRRDQDLSALKLKCNELALTQVQQLRNYNFEKMKQNMNTAGDFGAMMQQAGLSTREQYQERAKDNYNNCLKSNIYTEGEKTINATYTNTVKTIDEQVAAANRELTNIQEQMDHIYQANNTENNQKYQSAIARADMQYQNKYNSIVKAQKNLEERTAQQLYYKNQELMMAVSELQREESYLQQKQQFLALKRQFTDGDQDVNSSAISEAIASYGFARSAAGAVIEYCECGTEGKSGECSTANAFLDRGKSPGDSDRWPADDRAAH